MDLRWFEICYVLSQKTLREAFLEPHMEPSPGSWQKSDAGRLWSLLPSSSACEAHPSGKCLLKLGSCAPASFQQDQQDSVFIPGSKTTKNIKNQSKHDRFSAAYCGSQDPWVHWILVFRREELSPWRAAKRDELTNRGGARITPHHHYGVKNGQHLLLHYYIILLLPYLVINTHKPSQTNYFRLPRVMKAFQIQLYIYRYQ